MQDFQLTVCNRLTGDAGQTGTVELSAWFLAGRSYKSAGEGGGFTLMRGVKNPWLQATINGDGIIYRTVTKAK
jgi:hypothetical protein